MSLRKTLLWIFLLLLSCEPLVPLFSSAGASSIDSRIAAEERKRRELDRRIEDYRKRIKSMNSKMESLLGRIDQLQQNETVARQELEVLELQLKKVQEDISFLNAEMKRDKLKIDELTGRLEQRLLDMYKYGSSEELNLFFSSSSVFEAIESAYLLGVLARHDELLLSQLQSKHQEMELSRKTLDDHKARLREQTLALQSQREKYQGTLKETQRFIGSIRKKVSLAQKAAKEAEEAQKAVGQTILTLMRRKKEREAQLSRGKGSRKKSVDYLVGRGRGSMFDWPVRGPLSSGFGKRIHPVFKTKSFHSGIDIAAPAGTPVRAAAPGEVLFDGWLRGYGQVVIIDHGRNFSTVYAHLASSAVKEGQVVRPETVIGRVGKTGTTTGFHLHFEVRVGSVVKNPLDYLKR